VPTALPLRAFAIACVAIGLFPLANALTAGGAVPWWDLAMREWLLRGFVVVALAVVIAILLGTRVDAAVARARESLLRPSPRTFAVATATLALVAALFLAWYCFSGRPFTSDEMAQQWQARILLSGRLAAVAEPHAEFFNTAPVFDRNGLWFSQYPFGGPAFIAVGVLFGAAWIVNPLLLAVAVWHLYRFLSATGSETVARVTTLLFASSPMVLIMGASQMNHVAALAFCAIALAALARWDLADDARAQTRHAAIVGLALGVMATARPLDATVTAMVIGVFQLARARGLRSRWHSLAAQVVAGSVPVAFLLWVNANTTGNALLFGYDALNGPEHRLGFHMDPNGELHTPLRGLILASGYLLRLSRYLFEWPLPAMLFIAAGLAAIRRPTRWDLLLAALAFGFIVAYGAYWFDGFFSGPRFLFTAVPAFVYFAVRSTSLTPLVRPEVLRRAIVLIIPICILATWIGPDGVSNARGRVAMYRDQRTKLKTDIPAQVERAQLQHALVFVNEGWRGRLLARLRVLGASQFRAERVVSGLDACALGAALDAEDTVVARASNERLERVVHRARLFGVARIVPGLPADQTVAIVPGSTPTPACIAEFQRDTAGTIPYPPFLALQSVGPDGRVGGNVIFARDLGARNELLRQRFGDRRWYRYRPAANLQDTSRAFVPY